MTGLVAGMSWGRGLATRVGVVGAMGLAAIGAASCVTPSSTDAELEENPLGRTLALNAPGPPARVLMISVAGLVASDFLAADGYVAVEGDRVRMPRLAQLAREGVVGDRAMPPSPGSKYASHASLVTGRLPARHGVLADVRFDAEGRLEIPFWDSRMLEAETLWDAAIGRSVLALGWPTTVGARIELVLPEARSSDPSRPWLDLMRGMSSPFVIHELEVIAAEALGDQEGFLASEREPATWPTPAEKDAALMEVACHVALSERDPGLWLIRLDQTEAAQRSAGTGSVELAAALRRIDQEIGYLFDCLEEVGQLADTAIFVVGDVAYRPVHTRVDPNIALVAKGLIGRDPRSASGVRSWLAIARTHGRSAYVYAKDAANALAAREILETEAARTGAFRVVSAAELAQAGVDPQAWFGLEAAPGFEIGDGLLRPVLRPTETRASAGALSLPGEPAGAVGFVAWGRGIRSQVRVPRLELVDLAPTIAMLLGLRLDDDIDGTALSGILRAAVPPPPPGPKRLGVGSKGDAERTLREMGGGR
ncbi:MAG: alkaline phosphatase family protein [Deltaproteobacteria bacterium]|nr:alkaline phosphatase family protein [Deltaproteobacteria bacterium]